MSSSTLSDHFVLATYTSSVRRKSSKKHGPGVYATSYKKANTSDGYVTVAAQADGVHVIDVSTLHPIISHTLGPSTSFACPPLTIPSSSTQTSTNTYAVISDSPELSYTEDSGRTLWMWQDDSTGAAQKAKESKVMFSKGQTVYGLYTSPELSRRLVAVLTNGGVAVIDADSLDVKSTTPHKHSNVIHASSFPASTARFANSTAGAVLVLCQAGTSKTMVLRILAIDEADSISELQEHEVAVDHQKIASVSCSNTGILSVLALDGTLSSCRITPEKLVHLPKYLHLTGFSFISASSKLPASLLALTSSHVLLAAAMSQEIILLLWDVQFSVLLASHTLPIPSALSSSTLHVRLIHGAQSQNAKHTQAQGHVVLILSSDAAEHKTTSMLIAVPYSVPVTSTIAAAMGKGAAGKKWLRAVDAEKPSGSNKESPEEVARVKLLATMRTAMQAGRPQAAVAAFTKWAPPMDEPTSSSLDYNLVKELLNIALLPPSAESKASTTGAYASEVVQYLLEKRLVSSAMISTAGGLLGALRARNDWKTIESTFSKVLDLTEVEIVESLRVVVTRHRNSQTPAPAVDAMEVDPPATSIASSDITSLPAMLSLLANYPTSRGPLLVVLRRYIQDAADLTAILQVLHGWIVQRINMDKQLMPTKKDLKKTEHGVWVVVGRKGEQKEKNAGEVPPLEKVIDLVQCILDASFLSLLQYTPAHKVLRNIQTLLTPEIAFANAAETLRGPLEPFALAQEKAIKESLITPQEREREKQKGDWRQRRKGVGAAPGVAADIGVYQLEELVL
ncbi:hypothetical protein BDN70DRAFT_879661 [Pholiota conissans]|uniref:Uncharacterized protein n=1 Tax=Pholiota conissans TaxID=109636 RepID=A0A9P5Z398_9AGAR|nr:hypothetical protein BDN70DRAFT_879661 [Pholiota conissans]